MTDRAMYVVNEGSLFVLRQERYREQLRAGDPHPNDPCAFARSVEEMHTMVDEHFPNTDYSLVEKAAPKASVGMSL